MKKTKLSLICLGMALVLLLFPACSQGGGSSGGAESSSETLIPISLNGVEVKVGETTVQALLDKGLDVTWTDENYETVTVDPNQELEAEAYYTGGSVWVSDHVFANISFVTDEEPVPLGQAVIARLEFHMTSEDDETVLSQIQFDGVPVTELTREKAGEMYPDWTGDEVMWLKYGLDYKYDLNFDMSTGRMTQFTVECKYDVDWTGDN